MRQRLVQWFPIGWAIRQTLKNGYHFNDLKSDFNAAVVVSLIALPLSMALAIAIGLPPQHGIATAIVGGIVAGLFGGSLFQVSGPTAAFVVILIPIVADLGLRGIIWCQIIAGIILFTLGVARLGKWIHYVPTTVITGFTAGIGLMLATVSLKDLLGIKAQSSGYHFTDKIIDFSNHISEIALPEAFIGLITILLMMLAKKYFKSIPTVAFGVSGGILAAYLFNQMGMNVSTIGTEFHYVTQGGVAATGVPPYPPQFHFPTFKMDDLFEIPSIAELHILLLPSIMIAILIALESLLSATIADNLTGTKHHPNAELQGIGIANIATGLVAGIPATAAIARTATNIQNGAKSPFASILHAVLLLVYVLLLSPLINAIPISTLAAILILTAIKMSQGFQFIQTIRSAPMTDCLVLCTSFLLTLLIDMVTGVCVSLILASLFYMTKPKTVQT